MNTSGLVDTPFAGLVLRFPLSSAIIPVGAAPHFIGRGYEPVLISCDTLRADSQQRF
ncbi:hypothetical protein K439DRAFT_1634212 [Ramaria rubella]|nr:hypothetical protein K439DRAFT_1634212 [Ramaria rubella]